jgi:hypothetical protein
MGIVFDTKDIPMKGRLIVQEPITSWKIDVIGSCVAKYKNDLEDRARKYNNLYPKYIHWVIENPRGFLSYGYYLVREKRL